jgi:hypothetical protein
MTFFSGNGWLVACVFLIFSLGIIIYDFFVVKSDINKTMPKKVSNPTSEIRFNILAILVLLIFIGVIAVLGYKANELRLAEKKLSITPAPQTQTVTAPVNSPSLQVGTASNVDQHIDYSSKQIIQTNSGTFQGLVNAPAQTVNLTQIFNNNYQNTNPPNKELHDWLTNFEPQYESTTNDVQLLKKTIPSDRVHFSVPVHELVLGPG